MPKRREQILEAIVHRLSSISYHFLSERATRHFNRLKRSANWDRLEEARGVRLFDNLDADDCAIRQRKIPIENYLAIF